MTYADLLRQTADRKVKAVHELNSAVRHPQLGFLAEAELKKAPGTVAWLWLGLGFCKSLSEHWEELWSSANDDERDEMCRIYMAYEDSDPDIYEILPVEAQLFD